ncbi:cold-regulated protein 27 isoform X1 [Beta vulgaris subsp. vulgaris]|uniref:cold-regulated protein 27 isoform X1 n=1 Tax=Beta vulgaris subsp. vulgaris TaxID=3555 RepID=UPI00053FCC3F|nr:cold-regulated protein 27 isoform X1 [Beta vulgaris subsp. vulgaris]
MADSTSSQSSGVTGGDLSGSLEQEETSNLELLDKEPTSSEWTDEKHSLYLKSIETSFLHQLYSSMDSSYLYSQKMQPPYTRSSKHNESKAVDQFQIFQHGCWQRIKLGRGEPPPQRAGKCHLLLQNPWIQHFRSKYGQTIQGNASYGSQPGGYEERATYTRTFADISDNFPICQTTADSSIGEEFSGQNFDEGHDAGRICSLPTAKRMKTVEAAAQNHG